MTYGIWLSFNNQQEGFQIPVNPGELEIGDGIKSQTYDVAGLGEINVLKNQKLTDFRFSSIFPAQRYPFISSAVLLAPKRVGDSGPRGYVDFILEWMESMRPIRFIFTGDSFDINVAASIESFNWKEVAGSAGDIEYTLVLKKYVFYAAKKVKVEQASGATKITRTAPPRANDRQQPKTYTIRSGDTLIKIAKSQLGDSSRWREIQKLNGLSDAQLKTLQIGKVLKLPTGGGSSA